MDGLWLNAGVARLGHAEEVTPAAFDQIIGANLKGPVLQMATLANHLHEGASVVVTSSTSVYEGAPATSLYAAAKSALVALVRGWAAELGARNIRVNTLIPGPIDTRFRDFMPAAVATFLLSDDVSFVTGSQYVVDGGLLKR
ncbi:SDR family oxidoreductase [Halomonas aquamarina]|uniref:SDR family oxidoreductase n=1 Tax=Vreelandella aquamarina TaxID=77097 RepID=A0ACC5VU71_9GAMM|nr:SDR family oxidoreductase [Halomonas aquamarina]MBZ5487264.1 SDR family oxidoreductase [Halomonas aquamarina]